MKKLVCAAFLATSVTVFGSGIATASDHVLNGSFEQYIGQPSGQISSNADNSLATDWTTLAYAFLYAPGAADNAGAYSPEFGCCIIMAGPGSGFANGYTSTSPDGGEYIADDGSFGDGQFGVHDPITQTITGLTAGKKYNLGFYYAYAQQIGFTGATVQHWSASLGAETQDLPDYDLPEHAFSGWQHATLTFTADATTDVLGFAAFGTGLPPFALLDGVTLTDAAPEPAAWAMMLLGLGGVGGLLRRRRGLAHAEA